MSRIALIALTVALLASCQSALGSASVSGTLGTAVSIAANTETTINYGTLSLVVETSTASDVTLSAYASVETSMPEGYSALTFGSEVGFTLNYTGGGNLVKAELTTPPITVASASAITGSVQAGCVRYDADLQAYSKVEVKSYTAKVFVVDLPAAGTYVFAAVQATAPIPSFYVEARATGTSNTTLTYPEGFSMIVSTSVSNTVTVNRASTSARSDPSGMTNLGAFFDINLGSSSGSVYATLQYTYDASMSAAAAANIRIGYWDTGSSAWVFPSTGRSVNTQTRVVSQTTAHFSEWGVFSVDVVSGTLGSAVSIAANTETTINYGALSLVFRSSAASEVTLSAYASAETSMPEGYSALTFGSEVGFTLNYTGGGTLAKAELTTPPITVASASAITGSVQAGCVRYDADLQAYSKVEVKSYSAKVFVVDLPAAGTYVFAAVQATAPIPSFYAEARATGTSNTTISYPEGFSMIVSTSVSNTVTVDRATTSARSDPSGMTNLGAYFDINRGSASGSVYATLRYTYDASMSASAAANIKIGYWDTGSSAWVFPSTGRSVNTQTRVVSQTTAHFSEWGAFSSEDSFETTNQALSPASPSKCYSFDYDHTFGVVNFELTKVDGGGNLRMYLLKGTSCPNSGNHQMKTELVTDDGQSRTICLTSDTTPTASDGRFMVAVYAEGLSGTGSRTRFNLEVSNDLFCNSAAQAVLSAALLLVTLAVSAFLA